jgi:hypothetical protein
MLDRAVTAYAAAHGKANVHQHNKTDNRHLDRDMQMQHSVHNHEQESKTRH